MPFAVHINRHVNVTVINRLLLLSAKLFGLWLRIVIAVLEPLLLLHTLTAACCAFFICAANSFRSACSRLCYVLYGKVSNNKDDYRKQEDCKDNRYRLTAESGYRVAENSADKSAGKRNIYCGIVRKMSRLR